MEDLLKKFAYYEPVEITGGKYKGETGIYLYPLYAIYTDNEEEIYVPPHLVKAVNKTPEPSLTPEGDAALDRSCDIRDASIEVGDHVKIKEGDTRVRPLLDYDEYELVAAEDSSHFELTLTRSETFRKKMFSSSEGGDEIEESSVGSCDRAKMSLGIGGGVGGDVKRLKRRLSVGGTSSSPVSASSCIVGGGGALKRPKLRRSWSVGDADGGWS